MKCFSTRRLPTLLAAGAALCCFARQAQATSVTIANPSFEDPVTWASGTGYYGSYTSDSIPGWVVDHSNAGVIRLWPSWAVGYDGSNVMYEQTGSGSVHQTLSLSALTLQASTELTLSLLVGERTDQPLTANNITVRLTLRNQTVIPTAVASASPPLVSGNFVTWTRTYLIPGDGIVGGVDVVGTNATIEISYSGSGQAVFDLVTLNTESVPEPTTAALLLAGGAILAAFRARRALTAGGGRG